MMVRWSENMLIKCIAECSGLTFVLPNYNATELTVASTPFVQEPHMVNRGNHTKYNHLVLCKWQKLEGLKFGRLSCFCQLQKSV